LTRKCGAHQVLYFAAPILDKVWGQKSSGLYPNRIGEINMKLSITRTLAAASLALGLSALVVGPVQAQGSSTMRAQAKMDRDTFLSMARWDEITGNWVLKDNMAMPEGVLSRDEIKAMRDKFLSMNTWNESTAQWVPVQGALRDMSTLTRVQVKAETARFLKMHRFDESTSTWVAKSR
jgi:hypothetical protein